MVLKRRTKPKRSVGVPYRPPIKSGGFLENARASQKKKANFKRGEGEKKNVPKLGSVLGPRDEPAKEKIQGCARELKEKKTARSAKGTQPQREKRRCRQGLQEASETMGGVARPLGTKT